jgi:hypothetical protein
MTKTLMQLHEDGREERDRYMFERMAESFFNTWAPEDRYERSKFDAQFYSLVRQIYRDAQEPTLKQLVNLASSAPLFPLKPPTDR